MSIFPAHPHHAVKSPKPVDQGRMLYDEVSGLELRIDGHDFEVLESDTSSGFRRATTVVSLHGEGETGKGEDVTYTNEYHYSLEEATDGFSLAGEYTLDGFSEGLSRIDLFHGDEPEKEVFRSYRRWAFESAALDLALRQAGTDLATRLGREYSEVRFVVSTRLEDPPTGERVREWLERNPDLEFKLDPTSDWESGTVESLSETDRVRILDLKGQYEGTDVDQPADPELYRMVIEGFPGALIEDPKLNEETRGLFEGHKGRVSWDYPVQSVETIENLLWEPDWINIKPSRFGTVESVLNSIEYCAERGVRMYGGGQFELGVGRGHIQALASVFYPDAPNDVAPREYNRPEPSEGLPASPLSPPPNPSGIGW